MEVNVSKKVLKLFIIFVLALSNKVFAFHPTGSSAESAASDIGRGVEYERPDSGGARDDDTYTEFTAARAAALPAGSPEMMGFGEGFRPLSSRGGGLYGPVPSPGSDDVFGRVSTRVSDAEHQENLRRVSATPSGRMSAAIMENDLRSFRRALSDFGRISPTDINSWYRRAVEHGAEDIVDYLKGHPAVLEQLAKDEELARANSGLRLKADEKYVQAEEELGELRDAIDRYDLDEVNRILFGGGGAGGPRISEVALNKIYREVIDRHREFIGGVDRDMRPFANAIERAMREYGYTAPKFGILDFSAPF